MAYFVFAEFGNDGVVNFLTALRRALQAKSDVSPIHVTLRGPYKNPPTLNQLDGYAEQLKGLGVRIGGGGSFGTPNGFAVFLRAECSVFPNLWDKPDFRVPRKHIQPHITVFESSSWNAARQVRDFLLEQDFLIHTYNVHLSIYQSRTMQGDFFTRPTAVPLARSINRDIVRIPEGMLQLAHELGAQLARSAT